MDDTGIIQLYWNRDDRAIKATSDKYGHYCKTIAKNILNSEEDAEECVEDTYLNAWNAMPTHWPAQLSTFLGKITRNLSFNKYKRNHAEKRGGGEMALVLDELADCVSDVDDVEQVIERRELNRAIDSFVKNLSVNKRNMFVRRYWYADSVFAIAKDYGMLPGTVSKTLERIRKQLKVYLTERGFAFCVGAVSSALVLLGRNRAVAKFPFTFGDKFSILVTVGYYREPGRLLARCAAAQPCPRKKERTQRHRSFGNMKKSMGYYGPVALLLAGIVAVSALITAFTGVVWQETQELTVVTTVYPLYVAARNVVGDTPGVKVQNLTASTTGCLHDYQLSPADRITLDRARLLLLNGAGAEPFLADVLPALSADVVDTSEGIALLSAGGEHDHEEHDHEDPEHEEHTHQHEYNEHIWTSPERYAAQIRAVTRALAALDSDNREAYEKNGAAYEARVLEVGTRLEQAVKATAASGCITFHDSLAYLAADSGLPVRAALTVGEEGGVSAADLAQAGALAAADPSLLLLYDSQYTVRYSAVDRLVPAQRVLALDTGVSGDGSRDSWLKAMEKNLALLQQAAETLTDQ